MDPALGGEILCGVKSLPTLIHEIFEVDEDMKAFAKHYGFKSDAFFLGRAIDVRSSDGRCFEIERKFLTSMLKHMLVAS